MHPQKEHAAASLTPQERSKARRKLIAERQKNSLFWQIVHLLGSLQLALLLIATIGIACAVATFTESHFDTKVAHAMIYKAPWFVGWLALFCLNLFTVTLTRWPWEKKHLGFVITHYGIIALLIGAAIGSKWGFEGNVTLQVHGTPVQKITTSKSILEIESPLTQNLYTLPFDATVTHPSSTHPRHFPIPETPLHIVIDDWSETLQQVPSLVENKNQSGFEAVIICLRSQALHQEQRVALSLENPNSALFDFFGLAKIFLTPELKTPSPAKADFKSTPEPLAVTTTQPTAQQNPTNIPLMKPKKEKPWLELALDKNNNALHYQLGRGESVQKKGILNTGEILPLGWADWRFEFLQSGHHENVIYTLQPAPSLTDSSKPASEGPPGFHAYLENSAGQHGPAQWVVSGEVASLTLGSQNESLTNTVRVGYGLELRAIPFSIELLDFQVPRNEGTETPGDFRATVHFHDLKTGVSRDGLIHMNHPASFPGGFWANVTGLNYKFSQAEWNPRNLQETTLQVLYDPGWFLKWIGSLAICIGIALMFYWNKK